MNEKQKQALRELIEANEQLEGYRVVIDFAVQAILAFYLYDNYKETRNVIEDFIEQEYSKYDNVRLWFSPPPGQRTQSRHPTSSEWL